MNIGNFASVLLLVATNPASAFAPLSPHGAAQRLTATHLFEGASEPTVFFQNRIAEPADVESVPSAAYLLSQKFKEDQFVVQYRATNIYDTRVEKGPILDLSVLKQIKIEGNSVSLDPGVTVEQLAMELRNNPSEDLKELFVALPAQSSMSIAEAAIFGRYRKLNKAVKEVHIVDVDGNFSLKDISDVDVRHDIVVGLVLEPQERDKSKPAARWYSRKSANVLIPDGFVKDLPDDVKVIIHKHGMFNDIPNVVVFVDGGRDIGLPSEDWNEVVLETPQELWIMQNDLSDQGAFETLTATGVLDTSKISPSFEDVLRVFKDREENLLVWFEKGQIRASFDKDYPPDVDEATAAYFRFDEKQDFKIAPFADQAKHLMRKATALPTIVEGTTIPGFKGEIYDGVRGQMQDKRFQYATSSYDNMMNPSLIAYPLDNEDVSLAIKYATSDDPAVAELRKTLANPSGRKYKVMGRGGGHQYCGVSCDNGNFILSMEHFDRLEAERVDLKGVTGPDGKPRDVEIQLQVGTGNKLLPFAKFNNKGLTVGEKDHGKVAKGSNKINGWTVPHGECPTVGIGGHSQSGGYGHIVRAFGLCIDYIYGFTIVLADGTIKTVNRDSEDQADKDLYWAVLGGSPGAFGVTTNLVIHPILDKDYPNSRAYARTFFHSPEKMFATLEILEDFINRSQEGDEDSIAEELDLMVSLSSNNGNRLLPGLDESKDSIVPNVDMMLFELECRDFANEKAARQMKEIIEAFEKNVEPPSNGILGSIANALAGERRFDGKHHLKLSEMSLHFVRKPPAVTSTGRENRKPYRKMCYGSKDKVKEGWSQAFGSLLNDVVATTNDISCVFQVVVGGGKQKSNGDAKLNAIAHRSAQLHGIIFDLFRGPDDDSIRAADAFSKRFEIDVVNKHQTAYPKVMAQWASHGDLDMNKQEVWEKYFDDPAVYHKLRRIKKEVDPDDVFHSRFTIRPED